ncbi:MAG TPA: hypothetical protein VK943_19845 [Arenibaculum sp.]|nr:hypothetical protein [Arenibaculum sp.]
MKDIPVELDSHRGMAAQKATEARRHTAEVEADQADLRQRQDEMEHALCTGPASSWTEAGEKARYLITLFAATPEGRDPRHQTLIASVLDDIRRLSAEPPPASGGT